MWVHDHIEVIVTIVIAIIAMVATGFTMAFRIGVKVERLDNHTTNGLDGVRHDVCSVRDGIDNLSESVRSIEKESKWHHGLLIEHGTKIGALEKVIDTRHRNTDGADA
jgi:hypothetical protein